MRNSTSYKLAKPITFRRSSTKIQSKWGGNLQNIQKDMRELYESDGYNDSLKEKCLSWLKDGDISIFSDRELEELRVFIQRDQAGAEALIVAYDCENLDYRQLFIHGVKPHIYVALKLFDYVWTKKAREYSIPMEDDTIAVLCNTPIGKLKSNPYWGSLSKLIADSDNWGLTERYYYLAKQTVHSANYDIQAGMFQMNILEKSGGKIAISKDEAARFLMIYRALFPEIPERNRRVAKCAQDNRIIYNMLGFPYIITKYDIRDTDLKEFYAWGPQSTVGEITRRAYCRTQEYIEAEKKKWDLLADTHDSLLTQCRLYDVRDVVSKTEEFMNQRLVSPIDGVEFNMKSECQVGFNWAPFKRGKNGEPDKNELGLRELNWL